MGIAFNFEVILDNFNYLLSGAQLTLVITVGSLSMGLAIGLIVAVLRLSGRSLLTVLTIAYIDFFRCTPPLVQLVWIYYVLPILFGIDLSAVNAAILALGLNSGAFLAEIFRAGIQSIDVGQRDAAHVLGLSRRQTFRWIILPQAVRRMLPPIGSMAISLLKESSLASVLAVSELMHLGQLTSARTFRPLELLTTVAVIYFVLTYPLSMLVIYLERRYKVMER